MKRLALITLFSLFSFHLLFAQVGQHRTDLAIGISGGFVMNRMSFTPTIKQKFKSGMTIGFTARYTCEKYFNMICAFQGELNYSQAGWKENISTSADTYQRTIHYVQMPLFANLGFGRERGGVKGFLVIGPQLGFCIGECEKRGGEWSAVSLALRPNGVIQQYNLKVQKKFEYGIAGGLGMDVSTKKGHHFIIEGRYFYGLSDVFSNSKKDPFGRSANGTIYAKVSYLFDVVKTKQDIANTKQ
ncbi:MAG: PorT family protein [Bacteroidaceae bacterium]|nr:PorT family protein [Bacteroidaceae bacterium]